MTDDRGLAALAERLHVWFCGAGVKHGDNKGRPYIGWACERGAAAILGPSGCFSPDGGLDANRLAEAVSRVDTCNGASWVIAEAIAAEYARLATPKEEQYTCPHGRPLTPDGCRDCLHDATARAKATPKEEQG